MTLKAGCSRKKAGEADGKSRPIRFRVGVWDLVDGGGVRITRSVHLPRSARGHSGEHRLRSQIGIALDEVIDAADALPETGDAGRVVRRHDGGHLQGRGRIGGIRVGGRDVEYRRRMFSAPRRWNVSSPVHFGL